MRAGDRTELIADLLFWTLPDRMPAFVPTCIGEPAVIIGRSTLIRSDPVRYCHRAGRAAGVARGIAQHRVTLWGARIEVVG